MILIRRCRKEQKRNGGSSLHSNLNTNPPTGNGWEPVHPILCPPTGCRVQIFSRCTAFSGSHRKERSGGVMRVHTTDETNSTARAFNQPSSPVPDSSPSPTGSTHISTRGWRSVGTESRGRGWGAVGRCCSIGIFAGVRVGSAGCGPRVPPPARVTGAGFPRGLETGWDRWRFAGPVFR